VGVTLEERKRAKEKPVREEVKEEIKEEKPEQRESVEFLKLGDTVTSQDAFN